MPHYFLQVWAGCGGQSRWTKTLYVDLKSRSSIQRRSLDHAFDLTFSLYKRLIMSGQFISITMFLDAYSTCSSHTEQCRDDLYMMHSLGWQRCWSVVLDGSYLQRLGRWLSSAGRPLNWFFESSNTSSLKLVNSGIASVNGGTFLTSLLDKLS